MGDINSLYEAYTANNKIDPKYYEKFNVKRGLRNPDGSGVMAGVTNICNVHGYVINEGEKSPDEGKLVFRGYNINDLVSNVVAENRFGYEEIAYLLLGGKLPTEHQLENFRELLRTGRTRGKMKTVAIVGYTNAGKSTLLNTLTGAGVLSEDKLFATLDPTTRALTLDDGQQILLTDTVGFIRKLPHNLVEAFKSTLEEAKYADYIIHVVDCSNPQAVQQMEVVYDTLQELGVQGKKTITLFNKVDVGAAIRLRDSMADHTLKVSAKTGEGLEDLKQLLGKILSEEQIYVEKLFTYQEAGKIQLIREYGQLLSEEYTDTGILVKARVPQEIHGKLM